MRNLSNIKRIMIKIGSSSLVRVDYSVNEPVLVKIMQQFQRLKENGMDVALVTVRQ